MYLPAHFTPSDDEVGALLGGIGAADLITLTARGMLATMLPLLYDPPSSRGTGGDDAHEGGPAPEGARGTLVGHVARGNDQWREPALGEALVIVRGPDAYVTPSWYATKREHGRVVPTWNYVTAHLYGRLVIHDDPRWVEALVRRLTTHHESDLDRPWSVDDAPAPYIAGQLRAIVGVEVLVSRIEAKFKLSQNRSTDDVAGVIDGLEALGNGPMAETMRSAGLRLRDPRS
jgi:transcriptional regulator